MAKMFPWKKKVGRPRKKRGPESVIAQLSKTADEKLINQARSDPELKASFVKKIFGLEIKPFGASTQINDLSDLVIDVASQGNRQTSNTRRIVRNTEGKVNGFTGGGVVNIASPTSPQQIISFFDKLTKMLVESGNYPAGKKTYIVVENGKETPMDEAAFQIYMKNKQQIETGNPGNKVLGAIRVKPFESKEIGTQVTSVDIPCGDKPNLDVVKHTTDDAGINGATKPISITEPLLPSPDKEKESPPKISFTETKETPPI